MGRLVIVSNRLPVTIEKRKGEVVFHQSVGGLATGVSSVAADQESVWLGWADAPGSRVSGADRERIADEMLRKHHAWPVFLTPGDVTGFYHGFSNRTLWPLFHHFPDFTEFDGDWWRAYERVNRVFHDALLALHQPGDTIWIHDFHLMLLPGMLRETLPNSSIGFFLHIPFPSYEMFRILPWRRELLNGVLGADLIGFHVFDYAQHFLRSSRALLGLEEHRGQLEVDGRMVSVDAFPMGIDAERFRRGALRPAARRQAERVAAIDSDNRVILSVDRLDYTKGIPQRLSAYDAFLERYPEWRGRVRMIAVAVPSRTRVERYARLKREVDRLVGDINGRWGTVDWTPVTYLYRSLPFPSLVGLYASADVALVTPLRDGMNLVAKEYLASRTDDSGVLILSEMAGASRELGGALMVNPYDVDMVVDCIADALEMDPETQAERNRPMRAYLHEHDVARWAHDYLESLEVTKLNQLALLEHSLTPPQKDRLVAAACAASSHTFVLDYDGTLVGIARTPGAATPDAGLNELLDTITAMPRTTLVIASGRPRDWLQAWFGDSQAVLLAEHGAWVREPGGEWHTSVPLTDSWKTDVRPVIERAVARTPGSLIEEKDFSLAWHYRLANQDQAQLRLRHLVQELGPMAEGLRLTLLEGRRVLEVKTVDADKGRAAHRWMNADPNGFVLVAGDDQTDETLFEAAPELAWTIKVGRGPSRARFSVASPGEMRELLGGVVTAVGDAEVVRA